MEKKFQEVIDSYYGFGSAANYERIESQLQGDTREEKDQHLKSWYGVPMHDRHQNIRKLINGEETPQEHIDKVTDSALANIL